MRQSSTDRPLPLRLQARSPLPRRPQAHRPHALLRLATVAALTAASALAACARDAPAVKTDTVAAVTSRVEPGDSACPRTGLWAPCALLDRIVKAGLYVKESGDTVRVPYLTVPGIRYQVGQKASMVVFYYADSVALLRDLTPLDTVRVVPRGDTLGPWGGVPSLVRSANMVAVVIDGSATQVERVALAITAGAPQPFTAR